MPLLQWSCKDTLVRDRLKALDKRYKKASQAKQAWAVKAVGADVAAQVSIFSPVQLTLDKNVDAQKPGRLCMPEQISLLGVNPVEALEEYLPAEGLFSWVLYYSQSPREGMWMAYYSMQGPPQGLQEALFPGLSGAADAAAYGSGSATQSLGRWLWAHGWCQQVMSDIGGWSDVTLLEAFGPWGLVQQVMALSKSLNRVCSKQVATGCQQ
ncbi:hypothetical protein CYMTET_52475 [Cymbomonas tetramitiformis]|uniref:Uncharacterized protein n=1 Tax=Cymbomonas tetramitiformis TaxID=36881 RepID=A0AAE0BIZ1_9CHLO|nr:hypothetical protein CYMTET_52475 [Cymbomonas tetramitiformis]